MIGNLGSSQVTIKKSDLLDKIRKNRETHHASFCKAQEGYRAAVVKELDRMLTEAREGKRIRRSLELIEPMEHTRDYDRIIKMLEMSTADEITITEQQFSQYVLDEWIWKMQFDTSNIAYGVGSAQ